MALFPLLTTHPDRQVAIITSGWQIRKHGGHPAVQGRIESGLPVDRLPNTPWMQFQPGDRPPEHCRRLMTGMAMCSLGETPRDAIPGKHQGCIKVVPRDLGNIFTGTSDGRAQGLLQEVKAIELEGNKPDFATCYSSNSHHGEAMYRTVSLL